MAIRIRAATTLSVILLIAFGLQLVSIFTAPISSKIALATYGDYKFGVFGYCNISTGECSSAGIGYKDTDNQPDFALPSKARHSLANLLIVHVIACGLTLILLVCSIIVHFSGPASSSRLLLFVLILALPAFLLSLLAFLVDILLFVSSLNFAGWFFLASTVLIAISGIILCVMRRTLSSRKAIKRRINDPAELHNLASFNDDYTYAANGSGGRYMSNYYNYSAPNNPDQLPEFVELKYETVTDEVPLTAVTSPGNISGGSGSMGVNALSLPTAATANTAIYPVHSEDQQPFTSSPIQPQESPEQGGYRNYDTSSPTKYPASTNYKYTAMPEVRNDPMPYDRPEYIMPDHTYYQSSSREPVRADSTVDPLTPSDAQDGYTAVTPGPLSTIASGITSGIATGHSPTTYAADYSQTSNSQPYSDYSNPYTDPYNDPNNSAHHYNQPSSRGSESRSRSHQGSDTAYEQPRSKPRGARPSYPEQSRSYENPPYSSRSSRPSKSSKSRKQTYTGYDYDPSAPSSPPISSGVRKFDSYDPYGPVPTANNASTSVPTSAARQSDRYRQSKPKQKSATQIGDSPYSAAVASHYPRTYTATSAVEDRPNDYDLNQN